jgi:hypothetical protein
MKSPEHERDPKWIASQIYKILARQILRYPLLQIQDIYKLIYQAAMGNEHAVRNAEAARTWLEEEIKDLHEGPAEPMVDPISPTGDIVRVNLRPFLRAAGDLDLLLMAFIKTANEFHGSSEKLQRYWTYAEKMSEAGELKLDQVEMEDFFVSMKREGFPAVHHSEQYERNYHPAYRVIGSAYMHRSWSSE